MTHHRYRTVVSSIGMVYEEDSAMEAPGEFNVRAPKRGSAVDWTPFPVVGRISVGYVGSYRSDDT
jgi:hypothetical protein